MYEKGNVVNHRPWLTEILIRRAHKSPRLRQRMSNLLEEKSTPAQLVTPARPVQTDGGVSTVPGIPIPRFETFYRHAELTRLLQDYADALPGLIELRSIDKSFEGRDIWLVVVTNRSMGDDSAKPGFWVDGNIHAAELTASTACLYWLHQLAIGYAADDTITRLLRYAHGVHRAAPEPRRRRAGAGGQAAPHPQLHTALPV